MRTLILTSLIFLLGVASSFAVVDSTQLAINTSLSSTLSGTTSSGFDFSEIPKSAAYGLMGAGFLVLTVLRRRKQVYIIKRTRL